MNRSIKKHRSGGSLFMLPIHCSRAGSSGGKETLYFLFSFISVTLPNPLRTVQIYSSVVVPELFWRLIRPLMLGWHGHPFIHSLAVGSMWSPNEVNLFIGKQRHITVYKARFLRLSRAEGGREKCINFYVLRYFSWLSITDAYFLLFKK